MADISIIQISQEELKNLLSETLRTELDNRKLGNILDVSEDYLTREETAKLLKISLPTLNDYTKKGIITGYRLGSLVRYKRSEIEASLKHVQTTKYLRYGR